MTRLDHRKRARQDRLRSTRARKGLPPQSLGPLRKRHGAHGQTPRDGYRVGTQRPPAPIAREFKVLVEQIGLRRRDVKAIRRNTPAEMGRALHTLRLMRPTHGREFHVKPRGMQELLRRRNRELLRRIT